MQVCEFKQMYSSFLNILTAIPVIHMKLKLSIIQRLVYSCFDLSRKTLYLCFIFCPGGLNFFVQSRLCNFERTTVSSHTYTLIRFKVITVSTEDICFPFA